MSLRSVRCPLLGLGLLFPLMIAALPVHADSPPLAASDAKVLDFMADWQGDDGRWVDPMTFARIDPAKVKADDARRHGKPMPAAVSKAAPAAGTTEARDVR
ncbi:MAG TPA: hypothetical protein VH327_09415 [Gammaproteobacteria bacterium]|nr:hypothetical protein [Gammaproteobacteria bacterium]